MKNTRFVLGTCFVLALGSPALFGQAGQRPAANAPQNRPAAVRDQREDVRDRREDVRDRREDVRDRAEDVRDRREDVLDRREDVRDVQRDGGPLDRREDVRDRREDVVDRKEDLRDRREDVVDRRENVRDRVEDRIDRDPRLHDRVRILLPPNRTLADTVRGFKNHGQYIAALHVSRNLNISFDELKLKMTGERKMSLGSAIRELRPDLTDKAVKEETRRAEDQAKQTEKEAKATT
jgi:cyclic nucleotide gated channel beta 1